jgi:ribosomal-protein-alanine N-acetyltransferase
MLKLMGSRVILRDYSLDDLDAFTSWETDSEVMKYVSWISSGREESSQHLADAIEQSKTPNRQRYYLATELISTNTVIGGAGITILRQNEFGGIAEIGYFLLKAHWGHGYATEAAMLLIDYVFQNTKMHKVMASCNKKNLASEKVMKRCGMVKEAEFRKGRLEKGQWCDGLEYGLLKEEWKSRV